MPVNVRQTENSFCVEISLKGAGAGAAAGGAAAAAAAPLGETTRIILDMSLQRHAYRYTARAKARDMNSVLEPTVTEEHIARDLRQLGEQVERKLNGQDTSSPSFAGSFSQQLAAVRTRLDGLDMGAKDRVRNAVRPVNDRFRSTVFGDYIVPSRRVYRVDNTKINFMDNANHCYPIAGPEVWAQIDKKTFAAIAAFRKWEEAWERLPSPAEAAWAEILGSGNARRANEAFKAANGCRTQFDDANITAAAKDQILRIAGNTPLQKHLRDLLFELRPQAPGRRR